MKTLYIIDAYNLIYRMFYAIPEMNTREGKPVNAIFGVAKFLKSLSDQDPSASLVVASDVGKSFREDLFAEYKWQRESMPDNLRSQIEGVFELFSAAHIPILFRDGYEADDVIGSIAHQHDREYQVVIISSDKDLCQFVRDGRVHIFDAMKQKFMKEQDVLEKFSVPVRQVRDYLAIVGDASDNIPGISGFGPKKAQDLLTRYDTLEGIYEELWIVNYKLWIQIQKDQKKYDECELSDKIKQWLVDQIDNAFLSQKLATIITDLEIVWLPEVPFVPGLAEGEYVAILQKYEFKSLLPKDYKWEEKKSLEKKEMKHITSLSDLDMLMDRIRTEKKVYLATSNDTPISIGIWVDIYTIDPKQIDLGEFIDMLLSLEDLEITGYDLKEDYKRLLAIKKPIDWGVEGQGRLF
jgi:DNA polymerase I